MSNFKENAKKIVKEAMLTMQKPLQNATLNEMAKVMDKHSKFSFTVEINSNDHEPPHMHLINKKDNNLICKLVITESLPQSPNDFRCVEKDAYLTNTFCKELLEWAKALNEDKIQYWALAKTTWKMLHPKE